MSQILHIFRKDTRRFWIEIVVALAATLAFAWIYPAEWTVHPDANMMDTFTGIAVLVMIAAWWVLTTRTVQDERLVGNEQFWLTRPYVWWELLVAKVLFLAVWVSLPFLLAQHWLMHAAGFSVAEHAPLMLWTTVLVALVMVLPIFVVAALTSTFARMTMTVLAGFVLVTVVLFFTQTRNDFTTQNPYRNIVFYPLLAIGGAAALLLTYRTRRVWLGRLLALAVPVLLVLSIWAYSHQSLVGRAYPEPAEGAAQPVTTALSITRDLRVTARSYKGDDYVDLPLAWNGVAQGDAVVADNFRYTMTAQDGATWTSPWQRIIERVRPEQEHRSTLALRMTPEEYARFRSHPLTVKIDFALSRFEAEAPESATYPERDGAIAGVGRCVSDPHLDSLLKCRAAVRQPRLTYLTTQWTKGSCDTHASTQPQTAPGSTWLDREGGPDFRLSSIWEGNLFFFNRGDAEDDGDPGRPRQWSICPGAPIMVTHYHLIGRTRTSLTLTGFVLPENVRTM